MNIAVKKYDPIKRSLAAWRWLGYDIGQAYLSPFRPDSNPSFFLVPNKEGKWIGKDAGTNKYYDAEQAIQRIKGKTWSEADSIIRGLPIEDVVVDRTAKSAYQLYKAKKSRYVVMKKEFGSDSILSPLDIDIDIAQSVGFVRNRLIVKIDPYGVKSKLPTPIHSYAYIFPSGRLKIYNPYETKFKWFGNCNKYDVYGIHQMQNHKTVIITKSGKDLMLLKSIAKSHNLEFDVIAPNSESYLLPEEYMYKLEGKRVILWYDNDVAGKLLASKHREYYNAELVFNPHTKPKDPSDWYINNKQQFIEYLCQVLNI